MLDLVSFMNQSPVNFLAVATVCEQLEHAGFTRLSPTERWHLEANGRYYVTKNDSAVFAFIVGRDPISGFKIISAHSDSPCFRIKPKSEMLGEGKVLRLNTEVYGGPILYTWFDRPLSIAGRVIFRGDDPLEPESRLVNFKRPLLTIPHLAIHFNRNVNEGNKLSRQTDMMPVIAILNQQAEAKDFVLNLIGDELNVEIDQILDFDLSLYDTTPACFLGANDEFITSGRLDDLSMVHSALSALIASADRASSKTRVMAIFDNEETGSGTKQGAASPILTDIMRRVILSKGYVEEDYLCAIEKSFMISADNAHGLHPNYVYKYDPTNHPVLGGGPVIKINANCKYMTDADSAAVFRTICERANVPFQYFVNHSDVAGGSTLGNILTSQIPLRGVDMGAPLWAMHSIRETASIDDHFYTISAFSEFYSL
ncbi:MAG: M18 family aminopeptidase [Muribaculaceae bacterium]|nr:M18 family aminopeptidase [Muribaculaceae bacterium]